MEIKVNKLVSILTASILMVSCMPLNVFAESAQAEKLLQTDLYL